MGNRADPDDLDPHINVSSHTSRITRALFESLVLLEADGQTVSPGAAERWEVSGDGLVYTFHLRANGRWSTGEPVVAEDFRAGFLRLLDPKLSCESSSILWPITGARDFSTGKNPDPASVGIIAPDASTLQLRLRQPTAWMLGTLTDATAAPVHRPSMDRFDAWHRRGTGWTRPGALVGNGAFHLKAWRPGQEVTVEAEPNYWAAPGVTVKEIVFHPIEDLGTQERAYRAEQLHLAFGLPPNKVEVYQKQSPTPLHVLAEQRTFFLTFNVRRPPFTDTRVRRALALALDREHLVGPVYGALAVPARSFVRPGLTGYTPVSLKVYDPQAAKALLAEAGFPDGKGLPEIEFTLNSTDASTRAFGEAIQANWHRLLGVEVQLRPIEHKAYLAASRTRQFQVMLNSWGITVFEPTDMYQLAQTDNPNNDSQWSDRTYDEAYDRALRLTDPAERRVVFDTLEERLLEGAPHVPLYHVQAVWLVHPTVERVTFDATVSFIAKELRLAGGR